MTDSAISTPTLEADEICVLTSKGVRESRKPADIRGHDFRQSGFLAASELRRIRQRHEQFIRGLAARLAIFLRLEFTLQLSKVQIVGYQKFTENLPNPTHITLFKTEPLKGVGLLIIPPRLGLTLVDRLLGGPGQAASDSRAPAGCSRRCEGADVSRQPQVGRSTASRDSRGAGSTHLGNHREEADIGAAATKYLRTQTKYRRTAP